MAAPATREEFLELVRKSGVVDPTRLDAYLDAQRAKGPLPDQLGKVAGTLVRDAIITHFQAEQILQGKWRRFTIGKYKVLERIGCGGMGSVYLCEHTLMRRRVAVKVLPTARAAEKSSLERFYREARAVAALDHPNIVRAYDIDQDDKLHFIVMEYVDGSSLQEIVKRHGPLDVHRAAHYMSQAAEGLQHALEAAHVIHRDIKPGNILVDRTGLVKVLDMGLARFFNDDESSITERFDENVLGTADYLAPEQALDSHNVDIRADIYSLGATFYFCLTGSTPFEGGTVAQKLIWHQTRQPKSVRALRADVPEELAAVVEKMMAKEPALRYQTPAEVVAALTPWTAQPIEMPPEHEMPRLSPAAAGSGVNLSDSNSGGLSNSGPRVVGPSSRKWGTVPRSPLPQPATDLRSDSSERAALGSPARRTATATPRPSRLAAPIAASDLGNPLPKAKEVRTHPAHRHAAPETDNLQAQLDTIPSSQPRRSSTVRRTRKRRLNVRRNRWLVMTATCGVVAVCMVVWAFFTRERPPNETRALNSIPRNTWFVASDGRPHSFKSVREALYQAEKGDHIVVVADQIDEPLILMDGHKGRDVTIEAGNDARSVLWTCPLNPPEGRFVSLANAQGLRLHGFIFDGRQHVDHTVILSGPCPGLTMTNVVVRGFRRSGIATWNCQGTSEKQPVVLDNVRIVSTDSDADSGLLFNADQRTNPATNQFLHVHDCRFEGPYRKAAVQIASPTVGVEFRHNRFFNMDNGFLYAKASPRHPVRITLDSNTFCNVQKSGLRFEGIPLTSSDSRIIIRNNLFARTAMLAELGELERLGEASLIFNLSNNVCDAMSKEGNLSLRADAMPFTLSMNPLDDSEFLRYPKGAPLSRAGLNKQPVGVPPVERP